MTSWPAAAELFNKRVGIPHSETIWPEATTAAIGRYSGQSRERSMKSRTSLVQSNNVDEAYGLIHEGCLRSVLSIRVSQMAKHVSMTAFRTTLFGQPEVAEGTVTEADWLRLKFVLE